jgi:KaiC/GvpD/RAD55 family RecA-like ATPase
VFVVMTNMYDSVNNTLSQEDVQASAIERAIQWALEALFTGIQPLQVDLDIIATVPEVSEKINGLCDALRSGGEPSLRKAFNAFCKDIDLVNETQGKKSNWLKTLRNLAVPSRTEGKAEAEDKEKDPRFTIGKTGKKIIVRFSEDDIEALPDKEELIKDVLERGTVSMIYGPAGTGKTFNALNIAYCIAHGVHWFGHEVKKGRVWYINTEGGRGLKPRIAAWRKEYRRGKTSNIEFITWPVHLKEHSQELLDTVEDAEEKPSLLVIDNYSMCATGTNQNDQMEVTQTLMVLHGIAQRYGCHCLLVHHSNWTGKVNGSAAFRNHVDTMLDLSRPSKESPVIVLKCEKQRDGAEFADIHLELKIVSPYAHPVTGENITSCVVTRSDAPVQDALSPKQRQCLDLLCDGLTFAEWYKFVKDQISISEKTLIRYRDDIFLARGLISKKEQEGKHATYWKTSSLSSVEEHEYE